MSETNKANRIFGTTAEITGGVSRVPLKTVAQSGRLALRFGANIARRIQPSYVSADVRARQATLRKFEGRLGIAGNLIDLDPDSSDTELEARVSSTAADMVAGGLVDKHTTVELRPVLPGDVLRNSVLSARRENVVRRLKDTLAQDHDVLAISNTHPIMPSEHENSPVDIATTWSAITAELDGFSHQMKSAPRQHLAMMAITGPPYTQAIFEGQAHIESERLTDSGLLVLDHVGERPQENRLTVAR